MIGKDLGAWLATEPEYEESYDPATEALEGDEMHQEPESAANPIVEPEMRPEASEGHPDASCEEECKRCPTDLRPDQQDQEFPCARSTQKSRTSETKLRRSEYQRTSEETQFLPDQDYARCREINKKVLDREGVSNGPTQFHLRRQTGSARRHVARHPATAAMPAEGTGASATTKATDPAETAAHRRSEEAGFTS